MMRWRLGETTLRTRKGLLQSNRIQWKCGKKHNFWDIQRLKTEIGSMQYKQEKTVEELGDIKVERGVGLGKTYKVTVETLKNLDEKCCHDIYKQVGEILRRYAISSKSNAYSKLLNLIICKFADEYSSNGDVQFQCIENETDE